MPDFATALKEEIRRLARKEVRSETGILRKASAQYRRDIAKLKRELEDSQRKIAALEAELERQPTAPAPDDPQMENRRFSARGLRSHRKRLGLSAAELGKLCGVTAQTVYNWEQGKARPRGQQFAALVELRALGKRAVEARLDRKTRLEPPASGSKRKRSNGHQGSRSLAPPRTDLERLLQKHEGNVSAVARDLGKAPPQLYRWFRRYDIEPAEYR